MENYLLTPLAAQTMQELVRPPFLWYGGWHPSEPSLPWLLPSTSIARL